LIGIDVTFVEDERPAAGAVSSGGEISPPTPPRGHATSSVRRCVQFTVGLLRILYTIE
jgi:hypothetical protein